MGETTERPVAGGRGRRSRGGREARREQRAAGVVAPAYITRRIPAYEMLGEESLVLIERRADDLLAEVGVDIRGDGESLRLWREAGASVAGERVRFEQWQEAGSADANQRAAVRVRELLGAYQPPPIDAVVDEALLDFMQRRKTEMPDAWH